MANPSPARIGVSPRRSGLFRLGRKGRRQRAPDHQLDHAVVGDFVGPEAPHHTAVAQDGQAVAEIPHLLHPVRDEDDGGALRAQPVEQRAEPLHVVAGEGRGGLVQQQQLRLARDGAGDLDFLLRRQRQRSHLGVRVDIVEAEVGEGAPHVLLRFAPPDVPARAGRLIGQQHVLHDREVADQRNLLIGSLNAEPMGIPRRMDVCGALEQGDLAGVRPAETAQDLDQRRLARAVLAEERMDLAARNGERDVVERDGRAECLAQAVGFDRRRLLIHGRLPRVRRPVIPGHGAQRPAPRPLRLRSCRDRPDSEPLLARRDQLPSGTLPSSAE